MAAILGLDAEGVEKLTEDLSEGGVLGVAAYNADGQTVVSGERALVERAADEAKKRGARMAKVLSVSGAFHSGLMKDASEVFAAFLEEVEFQSPQVDFVSNFSGRIEKDPRLARKQGAYSVISAGGLILRRGHDLERVLLAIDRKLSLV